MGQWGYGIDLPSSSMLITCWHTLFSWIHRPLIDILQSTNQIFGKLNTTSYLKFHTFMDNMSSSMSMESGSISAMSVRWAVGKDRIWSREVCRFLQLGDWMGRLFPEIEWNWFQFVDTKLLICPHTININGTYLTGIDRRTLYVQKVFEKDPWCDKSSKMTCGVTICQPQGPFM